MSKKNKEELPEPTVPVVPESEKPQLQLQMDGEIRIRKIKVPLTNEEIQAAGVEMGMLSTEMESIEDDLKQVKDQYKAKMAEKEAQFNQCRAKVTQGCEMRDVRCTTEIDWDKGRRNFKDKDGKIVDWELLTDVDYQKQLAKDRAAAEAQTEMKETAFEVENDKGDMHTVSHEDVVPSEEED